MPYPDRKPAAARDGRRLTGRLTSWIETGTPAFSFLYPFSYPSILSHCFVSSGKKVLDLAAAKMIVLYHTVHKYKEQENKHYVQT
jgi:hypothetical protein